MLRRFGVFCGGGGGAVRRRPGHRRPRADTCLVCATRSGQPGYVVTVASAQSLPLLPLLPRPCDALPRGSASPRPAPPPPRGFPVPPPATQPLARHAERCPVTRLPSRVTLTWGSGCHPDPGPVRLRPPCPLPLPQPKLRFLVLHDLVQRSA